MKIRKLVVCATAAMGLSCLSVYLLVPPGEASELAAAPVVEPAEPEPDIEEESEPEEAPASLLVEARVGHEQLAATGERRTYVMMELRGKESAKGGSLQTSTALVLDTSGSMAGMRMTQAAEAARRWVQRAPDGDVVTVLGFSQEAREIVSPIELDASSREFVLSRLTGIRPAGDTCLSCGVQQAAALVRDEARIQRVVVLSDGRANKGIRDVAGIRTLASVCRDKGISVSTVGLGTGYNEKVLSALAFDANGLHHFVQDALDLPKVFEREESVLRATVASRVTANIDLAPGVQLVQVLDRKFRQSGNRVSVDVGPIAAGASRTVLLEVRLPNGHGDTPIASTTTAFNDVPEGQPRELTRTVMTRVGDVTSSMDGLVAMRLERARTGHALEEAAELFAQGKKVEALAVLDRRVSALGSQAVALPNEASNRGDTRAEDIRRDLQKQIENANKTRRQFKRARPKAPAPVKRARPMMVDAFL